MKYSKELHDALRHDLQEDIDSDAVFTFAAFECLLDEIDRLNAERRWIPVSERLPEVNSHVLVSMLVNDAIVDGETAQIIESSGYNGEKFVCFMGEFVTHWMPLPEPPEEELTAWEKIKPDLVGIIKKMGGNNAR